MQNLSPSSFVAIILICAMVIIASIIGAVNIKESESIKAVGEACIRSGGNWTIQTSVLNRVDRVCIMGANRVQ